MEYTKPDASLSGLVQEVRSLREPLLVCPSAKTGVCINDVLAEIVNKEVYRNDYETITGQETVNIVIGHTAYCRKGQQGDIGLND